MAKMGKAIIKLPKKISKGSVIKVQSIIIHPNHSGLVKDKKTKKLIPAHYINKVVVEYGGKTVYDISTSAALSKDPYFAFNIKADTAGELKMTWKDMKGKTFEKTKQVTPV